MELALGRLKSSPFRPEVLEGLREEWFGCVEAATGARSSELREIPPNQPFYLHAISSTARLLEDPDWEAIACQKDSYVTGVAIGFDEPAPHLPQVYEFKFKSRKLDDSEDEWHRDNYSSAKQTIEQRRRWDAWRRRLCPCLSKGTARSVFGLHPWVPS